MNNHPDPLIRSIAEEEKLLDHAPDKVRDGDCVSREADEGPTGETILAAYQILEAENYGVELAELAHVVRQDERDPDVTH